MCGMDSLAYNENRIREDDEIAENVEKLKELVDNLYKKVNQEEEEVEYACV